jgi:hypothetical protein
MRPRKLFMEISIEVSTYPALLILPRWLSPIPTRASSIQEEACIYMNTRHERTTNSWKWVRWHKLASNQSYLHAHMHIWAAAKHCQARTIGWCRVLPNSEYWPTLLLQQALKTILRWFHNRLKLGQFLPITRIRANTLTPPRVGFTTPDESTAITPTLALSWVFQPRWEQRRSPLPRLFSQHQMRVRLSCQYSPYPGFFNLDESKDAHPFSGCFHNTGWEYGYHTNTRPILHFLTWMRAKTLTLPRVIFTTPDESTAITPTLALSWIVFTTRMRAIQRSPYPELFSRPGWEQSNARPIPSCFHNPDKSNPTLVPSRLTNRLIESIDDSIRSSIVYKLQANLIRDSNIRISITLSSTWWQETIDMLKKQSLRPSKLGKRARSRRDGPHHDEDFGINPDYDTARHAMQV